MSEDGEPSVDPDRDPSVEPDADPSVGSSVEPVETTLHDDTGLDLARSIARSIAGSAQSAPTGSGPPGRAKRRRRRAEQDQGRRPRGGRGRASGAFPDERDPQLLDSSLGRLVSDQGWALDLKVHGVFGRWAQIVGDEVAQHCSPTSLVDGRLVVRTDSTAWATQLRLLAPTLVRRLNEELGHGAVTLIDVEGPNLPSWKKGRLGVRDGRGPRDTYG